MKKSLLYVGLDVHAQTVTIAITEAGGEVRIYGTVSSDLGVLEKIMRKIKTRIRTASSVSATRRGPLVS